MAKLTTRAIGRFALLFATLLAVAGVGSATANATGLDEYRWESRPLLLFAPTSADPRLVETLSSIESSRCAIGDRDMVIGVVATEGASTLDGRVIGAPQAQQLKDRYSVSDNSFRVVLIGKDGTEKWRADDVPDLQTVFAVIDGMPMRGREMAADPGRC